MVNSAALKDGAHLAAQGASLASIVPMQNPTQSDIHAIWRHKAPTSRRSASETSRPHYRAMTLDCIVHLQTNSVSLNAFLSPANLPTSQRKPTLERLHHTHCLNKNSESSLQSNDDFSCPQILHQLQNTPIPIDPVVQVFCTFKRNCYTQW